MGTHVNCKFVGEGGGGEGPRRHETIQQPPSVAAKRSVSTIVVFRTEARRQTTKAQLQHCGVVHPVYPPRELCCLTQRPLELLLVTRQGAPPERARHGMLRWGGDGAGYVALNKIQQKRSPSLDTVSTAQVMAPLTLGGLLPTAVAAAVATDGTSCVWRRTLTVSKG